MKLTTYLYLKLRLTMIGAETPTPPYNFILWCTGSSVSNPCISLDRPPGYQKFEFPGVQHKKGKTQEGMERGSRKRSSSAGSEKMERVGGR